MATSNIKAIHPYDDPRVTHKFQVVNGKNYRMHPWRSRAGGGYSGTVH